MLHIILLILKIIGWILLALLGLVVLLIVILLFAPVRYELKGRGDADPDTIRVRAKATWLLHLLRVDVSFRERKLKWRVRIVWKKILGGRSFRENEDDALQPETADEAQMSEEELNDLLDQALHEKETAQAADDRQILPETEAPQAADGDRALSETEAPQAADAMATENCEAKDKGEDADAAEQTDTKAQTKTDVDAENQKTHETEDEDPKSGGIFEKLTSFAEKIKCTIETICAKIKALTEKKGKAVSFIEDETHMRAVRKAKDELSRLLGTLRPRRCRVCARFGFAQPERTGWVLAALAVCYPVLGADFEVTPDFEKPVFHGDAYVKGHIRICHFAASALRLLLCRAIRQTIKDLRALRA